MPAGKAAQAYGGARFLRKSANSSSTDAIVLLRDSYSQWDGGIIETQNNHPNGIVQLGHENTTTSNWNALYWKFQNVRLIGGQIAGNIGIYIPNSHVALGISVANYFGAVENVSILNSDIGVFVPEISNAHYFSNVRFFNMISAAYRLRGAYGCSVFGGILHTSTNGVVGVQLLNRTVGTDHHSESNSFCGFAIEPGGSVGTFLISRVGGGATVTELTRNTTASGVTLQPCTVSGNDVLVRVAGFNNGTGTSYNDTAEVSVVVDNFAAVTLS